MNPAIELIVGLGNPGPKYEKTRHNLGMDVLLRLAVSSSAQLKSESRFLGDTARARIAGHSTHLLMPNTFMNNSGQAVGTLARFYRIAPERILIIHDELDLPVGVARLKKGGGHGGHNGLRSIIKGLGNNSDFARLRIGIGHPGHADAVVSYVLKKPPPDDRQITDDSITRAIQQIPLVVSGQWEKAMTALHSH
jgi:PTH1 family peptidyl-tRNA hydrolase